MNFIFSFLISIILTIASYMAIPLILCAVHRSMTLKSAKIISVFNSIIVFFLWNFFSISFFGNYDSNTTPAIIWGIASYFFMKKYGNITTVNRSNKKPDWYSKFIGFFYECFSKVSDTLEVNTKNEDTPLDSSLSDYICLEFHILLYATFVSIHADKILSMKPEDFFRSTAPSFIPYAESVFGDNYISPSQSLFDQRYDHYKNIFLYHSPSHDCINLFKKPCEYVTASAFSTFADYCLYYCFFGKIACDDDLPDDLLDLFPDDLLKLAFFKNLFLNISEIFVSYCNNISSIE